MSFNLPIYKNFGREVEENHPELNNQLSQMYTDIANTLQTAVKKNVVSGADPSASAAVNAFFSIGDITVRSDTDTAWIMTSRTTDIAVTWTQIT